MLRLSLLQIDSGSSNRDVSGPLATVLGSYPVTLATTAFQTGQASLPKSYPLSVLLLVALIAFLFGSLLRSLLTPADFILYPRPEGEVDMNLLAALEPHRRWRQARRLLEIRLPFLRFDLMIASVRRARS